MDTNEAAPTPLYNAKGARRHCTGADCGGVALDTGNAVRNKSMRDGYASRCYDCRALQNAASYAAHVEQRRESKRKWRAENPEQARNNAARNAARADTQIASDRAEAWPEGEKPCRSCGGILPLAAFYVSKARRDGLQLKCRDCGASYDAKRRSGAYLQSYDERADYECWLCGGAIGPDDEWHIEHRHPVSRDGADTPDATSPAHAACNLRKHAASWQDALETFRPGLLASLAHLPLETESGAVIGTLADVIA